MKRFIKLKLGILDENLALLKEKGFYFKVKPSMTEQEMYEFCCNKCIRCVALRDDKSLGYMSDDGTEYINDGYTLIDINSIDNVNKKELAKKVAIGLGIVLMPGGLLVGAGLLAYKKYKK